MASVTCPGCQRPVTDPQMQDRAQNARLRLREHDYITRHEPYFKGIGRRVKELVHYVWAGRGNPDGFPQMKRPYQW